jgi:hypothetical protein
MVWEKPSQVLCNISCVLGKVGNDHVMNGNQRREIGNNFPCTLEENRMCTLKVKNWTPLDLKNWVSTTKKWLLITITKNWL